MQVVGSYVIKFLHGIVSSQLAFTFTLFCNYESAVVWNPWAKKAKAMPDLGDEDYKIMICVSSAAIETPVLLKPSEEWMGYQELSTVSSSYCSGQLDPRKVLYGFH